MLVHHEFTEMPPKMFMMQIMGPLAKVYCFLWERKDQDNRIQLTWDDVSKYYHGNNFRTSVRKLNNEGLLDYKVSDVGISIELVGWDEISDE